MKAVEWWMLFCFFTNIEGDQFDQPFVAKDYMYSELDDEFPNILKSDENSKGIDAKNTESQALATEDEPWVSEAVRDVAYYLRAHKFNEWDRRFHRSYEANVKRNYYMQFPRPPLRELHWEVKENCEVDFLECLKYLQSMALKAPLKRLDDPSEIMQNTKINDKPSKIKLNSYDADCKKMERKDNYTGSPFAGPIERFRWRTTASYYMCWYAMHGRPALGLFGGDCDNHANCLDTKYGVHNKDPRADDKLPYQCAMYSFCPDPCCQMKHLSDLRKCWDNELNPCFTENAAGNRSCTFNRSENTDFVDIVLNRWNVSCMCSKAGFKWDSRFGICVDVDECEKAGVCDNVTETCLNLPGSFACMCQWGYERSETGKKCTQSLALRVLNGEFDGENLEFDINNPFTSILKKITNIFKSSSANKPSGHLMSIFTCLPIVNYILRVKLII